jgi:hypothetical protein
VSNLICASIVSYSGTCGTCGGGSWLRLVASQATTKTQPPGKFATLVILVILDNITVLDLLSFAGSYGDRGPKTARPIGLRVRYYSRWIPYTLLSSRTFTVAAGRCKLSIIYIMIVTNRE